jgi:hypothetical protein
LELVEVKKAVGAGDAELRPFPEVHGEMREAAKRAVETISESKAVNLTTPSRPSFERYIRPDSICWRKSRESIMGIRR